MKKGIMSDEAKFYLRQLNQLIGGTITQLVYNPPDDMGDEYLGLVVVLPDGQKKSVVFLSDDEGNGPGSFEIDEA